MHIKDRIFLMPMSLEKRKDFSSLAPKAVWDFEREFIVMEMWCESQQSKHQRPKDWDTHFQQLPGSVKSLNQSGLAAHCRPRSQQVPPPPDVVAKIHSEILTSKVTPDSMLDSRRPRKHKNHEKPIVFASRETWTILSAKCAKELQNHRCDLLGHHPGELWSEYFKNHLLSRGFIVLWWLSSVFFWQVWEVPRWLSLGGNVWGMCQHLGMD